MRPRILLWFVLTCPLIAGINIDQVRRFTIADGLSQNYVSAIIQDQIGYLWIGTKDGLNRYDGYSFTVFYHIPGDTTSLSNDDISLIKEGSDGVLWIGTNGGGLNRFAPRTGHLRTFFSQDAQSQEAGSQYINVIAITGDSVLIGTRDGLIYQLGHTGLEEPRMVATLARDGNGGSNPLTGILLEKDGSILVAPRNGGLQRYMPPTRTWATLIRPDSLPGEQRLNPINGIFRKDNVLWIGRYTGLEKYDLQTGVMKSFTFRDHNNPYLRILAIAEDEAGHLWLVSPHHLIRFDPARESYEIFFTSESDWFTGAICIDRSGIVWLGTAGKGLFKIRPQLSNFNATPGNYLAYLYPDLIDTIKYLTGFDPEVNRARDFLSVIRDRDNNYWVASQYHGLFEISSDVQTIRQYPNSDLDFRGRMKNIYAVFEDRKGEIWATCAGGICRLDREKSLFEYHRLYPGRDSSRTAINNSGYYDITALYQDRSGIFWVGTPTLGLIRYDPEEKQLRYFQSAENDPGSISANFVLSIAEDPYRPDQILWIGTDGGGLNRYDKITDEFTTFSTVAGLPNNTVYGILPDPDNHLWLSTNQGLSRFNPVNKSFKNFTVSDGLQSNEFNRREYVKTADGELIFGGINGFNHFYPRSIQDNPISPQVVIAEMTVYSRNGMARLDDRELQLKKEIVLDYADHTITIGFSGLEFTAPEKNRFAYRLEPFNKNWIYCGTQRSATYSNLSPGHYVFWLKAANGDDVWGPEKALLKLEIEPLFWQTLWFQSLAGLSVLLIAGGLMTRRMNLDRKKRENQRRFARQLIQSQEKERGRIAGELHDGIGQDLLLIKNTIDLGLKYCDNDRKAADHFRTASKIVSAAIREVREVSHNLSPQHLEQLGLSTAIESVIESLGASTAIQIKASLCNIDGLLPKSDEIILYRIIQESLNNIMKHSTATEVRIVTNIEKQQLRLIIEDNGSGIAREQLANPTGIGLAGMFERTRMLGGELTIRPGLKKGTRIELILPLKEKSNE